MRIKITQYENPEYGLDAVATMYRADPADMPGTPPNGEGRSKAEAVGVLIFRMAGEITEWDKFGWPVFKIDDVT